MFKKIKIKTSTPLALANQSSSMFCEMGCRKAN